MKVAVIYYSMTGSVYRLARSVEEGAAEAGATVRLRRAAELIPQAVIDARPELRRAQEEQRSVETATVEDLVWADGVALGSPTRFGNITAQLKNFLDQTGGLWAQGTLVGKAVGFFTGANTMHGGHETTILTMSTFAYHHGMVIVPASYAIPQVGTTRTGGSPYGPSEFSGKGVELSEEEAIIARAFGARLAQVAGKLAR
ncbi:MAG: NAD(P)H:quinone oxidoreductase [Thermaerobacter sp.]|nr:NAD(P)H:quinone oxidoreductase [Thermaerobacter sp.]